VSDDLDRGYSSKHAAVTFPFSQWGSYEGTLRVIRSHSPEFSHRIRMRNVADFSDRCDVAIHLINRFDRNQLQRMRIESANANIVMAAFLHVAPGGMRFQRPTDQAP
jgi:hypothetical protein